ncbi:VOC family protein [Paenibacillus sp. HJGM_3]|uniref:VOC family protein n=1 Tax=Paenibacillus sp. HJGM_3 TaxID=3379816 RepID=UPI00385BAB52
MPVQLLGGVFVSVTNLERSIEFYTEMLGLHCRGIEDWGDGRRGATLFFKPHPEHAALFSLAEVKGPILTSEQPAFNFKCSEIPDLHEALQVKGCRVTELESWDSPWNHHLMFDLFDPDGHRVNLIELVPIAVPRSK